MSESAVWKEACWQPQYLMWCSTICKYYVHWRAVRIELICLVVHEVISLGIITLGIITFIQPVLPTPQDISISCLVAPASSFQSVLPWREHLTCNKLVLSADKSEDHVVTIICETWPRNVFALQTGASEEMHMNQL